MQWTLKPDKIIPRINHFQKISTQTLKELEQKHQQMQASLQLLNQQIGEYNAILSEFRQDATDTYNHLEKETLKLDRKWEKSSERFQTSSSGIEVEEWILSWRDYMKPLVKEKTPLSLLELKQGAQQEIKDLLDNLETLPDFEPIL